jgi:hypothetical protein
MCRMKRLKLKNLCSIEWDDAFTAKRNFLGGRTATALAAIATMIGAKLKASEMAVRRAPKRP